MTLTYLKIEPEQAVTDLNELIVSGYQLKDKLVAEYGILTHRDKPGGREAIVPPETRAGWTQQLLDWAKNTVQKLQDVYLSLAEVYKFKEAQTLPMMNSQFDNRFYSQLLMLQARLDILNGYKDFIFQHSNIQIVAGRDANVQIGGTHHIQEVNNERQ